MSEPEPVTVGGPGWQILQGQAVWQPSRQKPELAGDLVLATNNLGDYMVSFSKTPFPIASADSVRGKWRIQFADTRYYWHGKGSPPQMFPWFELPRAIAGAAVDPGWRFEGTPGAWRLENRRTGERLEGFFAQ